MKNILIILALSLAASTASAQYVDDLYGTPPPSKTKSKSGSATVQSTQSTSSKQKTYTGSGEYSYSDAGRAVKSASASDAPKELITSYDEALQRRLSAMRSATYDQPESYWKLMEQYQSMLEKKYNQSLYNIVVVGDEMWVEPQSITAQFDGSDPAEGVIKYNEELRSELKGTYKNESYSASEDNSSSNVTIQLVIDPFDFWGYSSFYSPFYWGSYYNSFYSPWYSPFYSPWYSPWGYYPSYYRPYWGGYYPHYHGGYYGNPRGTYYGNSRYGNNSPSYRPSSGGSSRPNRGEGVSGMGGTRRPNGSNTVYGGGGRPSNSTGGVSSARPNVSRPNGAPSYDVSGRPNSRPSAIDGMNRPSSTSRPNVERPTYNRNETTYERPSTTSRPSSISRPSTTTSRPSTISRPSGGGGGSGVSRPSGGGRGR